MLTAIKSIDEIKAELEAVRAKKVTPERQKRDWYGLVYCDSNGWASIVGGDFKGIWLGKTNEIIPYLKGRGIKGENVDIVLQAVKEFWSEKESQSYHLATKVCTDHIVTPPEKSNRITFKEDPKFLRLLGQLIDRGYGVPTIQKELKDSGYGVAYATLGRWIKKIKETK